MPNTKDATLLKVQKIIKRLMDIIISIILLILTAPIFAILFLIISSDGDRVFFGHARIGRNGKPFRCWKLRTMVPNAQKTLDEFLEKNPHAKREWEETFKLTPTTLKKPL